MDAKTISRAKLRAGALWLAIFGNFLVIALIFGAIVYLGTFLIFAKFGMFSFVAATICCGLLIQTASAYQSWALNMSQAAYFTAHFDESAPALIEGITARLCEMRQIQQPQILLIDFRKIMSPAGITNFFFRRSILWIDKDLSKYSSVEIVSAVAHELRHQNATSARLISAGRFITSYTCDSCLLIAAAMSIVAFANDFSLSDIVIFSLAFLAFGLLMRIAGTYLVGVSQRLDEYKTDLLGVIDTKSPESAAGFLERITGMGSEPKSKFTFRNLRQTIVEITRKRIQEAESREDDTLALPNLLRPVRRMFLILELAVFSYPYVIYLYCDRSGLPHPSCDKRCLLLKRVFGSSS